jgi:hypothetical protein
VWRLRLSCDFEDDPDQLVPVDISHTDGGAGAAGAQAQSEFTLTVQLESGRTVDVPADALTTVGEAAAAVGAAVGLRSASGFSLVTPSAYIHAHTHTHTPYAPQSCRAYNTRW